MVQKVSPTLTLKRLRDVQWHRIFHMVYIEPVVFMLLFSITLSSECLKWPLYKLFYICKHLDTIMRNQIIYQTCTVIFHYNVTDCKLLDDKNSSAEIKVYIYIYVYYMKLSLNYIFSRRLKRSYSRMWLIYFYRARCWRVLCLLFLACSLAPGRITMDGSHC